MDTAPLKLLPPKPTLERRADGTIILGCGEPLRAYARSMGDFLERWAAERPSAIYLAQRSADGWRTLTWGEVRKQVRRVGTALLESRLSPERPLVVLSDNSIEHALLTIASLYVGVTIAPISPSYSLMSKDFKKLKNVFALLEPGMVFVDDADRYAPAIAALADRDFELVVARNADKSSRPATMFDTLLQREDRDAVDRAFASVGPDTIAKFLLTSGSTGEPKAVINTQRMLCSNRESGTQAWPFIEEHQPVLVDWLPWNHTFGGNNDFGLVLAHGGSLYIDEGKPAPGLFETTIRNLREISSTIYYNVPRGYDMLVPRLEEDAVLRRTFFARLEMIMYAGAPLPAALWDRLDQVAIKETGHRIRIYTGWGSTETAPQATLVHFPPAKFSALGLPSPGTEIKMVPADDMGKYELRVRGPNVTPGYWKRPDLTADAFDDEGFYKIGDAGRFVDPEDPAKGIEFAGRIAEDFKLNTGTWVHVGPLKVRSLSAMAPVAQDIVVAGQERNEIGFLIIPSLAGCRTLCPGLADASIQTLISDERVRARVREGLARLQADGGGSSTFARRALFLEEPPSIDAGEITDKGYINQRAVLTRRAVEVERLYGTPAHNDVIEL
jgi:feruloyl-CoA synthase